MKTKLLVITLVFIMTIIYSCKKPIIGKWSDNIQLSGREFNFNSVEDSAIITAKGKWWGINYISLDTNKIFLDTSITDICNFSYLDSNVEIESKNCNTLKIKMRENKTSSDRILRIGLWAGDYFDGIKITQKKK